MNTEKVSDTPRTDAEQEHVNNAFNDQVCTVPAPDPYFVPVGFARQLERELAEWKECAKGLLRALVVRIDSGNTQVDEWEGFALAEFGRLNGEPAPTTEVDKLKGAPPSP